MKIKVTYKNVDADETHVDETYKAKVEQKKQ
jgi:hypothetical protein